MAYKKLETDKFICYNCRHDKMYPNQCDSKIMGFVCSKCGAINYPTKDAEERRNMR